MARAMLRNTPILVFDEATANVDQETDSLIQKTLRSARFAQTTIIAVAHRLDTILDYDLIVVLDKGKVMESGSPKELLENDQGIFPSMVGAKEENDNKNLLTKFINVIIINMNGIIQ